MPLKLQAEPALSIDLSQLMHWHCLQAKWKSAPPLETDAIILTSSDFILWFMKPVMGG